MNPPEEDFLPSLKEKCLQTAQPLLRYPGGKQRAVKIIMKYIPEGIERLCSPFLGGGSIELACAGTGIKVLASDAFEPLTTFWDMLMKNPVLLATQVKKYYPLQSSTFYSLQKSFPIIKAPLERAAVFYVLNRASFSGTTLSGGMSKNHPRFTLSGIKKLEKFYCPNLSVSNADFRDALHKYADDFLYLDPPYANGGRLYGIRGDMHKEFPHDILAEELRARRGWILSYNDSSFVRQLYKGYRIEPLEWQYGMSIAKNSNEVLVISA
ncbi:MAG: DNA adenine methylase [Cytophagales bacterium]|nr:DNA adenine methylase [Cytophagales bacterium]